MNNVKMVIKMKWMVVLIVNVKLVGNKVNKVANQYVVMELLLIKNNVMIKIISNMMDVLNVSMIVMNFVNLVIMVYVLNVKMDIIYKIMIANQYVEMEYLYNLRKNVMIKILWNETDAFNAN